MGKLILTWAGEDRREELDLNSYELKKVTELHEWQSFPVLNLIIKTETKTLRYRICADPKPGRYTDLELIERTINEGFRKAMEGKEIEINEFEVRYYLNFIFPENEKLFEYTGGIIK